MSGIDISKIRSLDADFVKMQDFSIPKPQRLAISEKIKKLEEANKNPKVRAHKRGELFEDLILQILCSMKVFRVLKNAKTPDNEIDFLVTLNRAGRTDRSNGIIPKWIPDSFVIECKNYSESVPIDYVGKFFSLMTKSSKKLGLFISNAPITGRGKKYTQDAASFVNKVNLKHSLLGDERVILIDICLERLKSIVINEDYDFIELLIDRLSEIESDYNRDLVEHIKPHANEGKFN